eukprot:CAMPEP_0179982944 /NCGR_PEP_ID=MMETSP0984-20121128/257_1 /TAXON_ID=483367 /ORGANISM="non described non described, Strain CCMP 2436" /LENGTH=298 /DNA_ID=CAMNT_0021901273 /DNA_START=102 /DNA_END=999 /DNA_ORIENTATION=-
MACTLVSRENGKRTTTQPAAVVPRALKYKSILCGAHVETQCGGRSRDGLLMLNIPILSNRGRKCAHLPLERVLPGKTAGLILDVGGAARSMGRAGGMRQMKDMPSEVPTADESTADERYADQGEHADEEVDRAHHIDLLESLLDLLESRRGLGLDLVLDVVDVDVDASESDDVEQRVLSYGGGGAECLHEVDRVNLHAQHAAIEALPPPSHLPLWVSAAAFRVMSGRHRQTLLLMLNLSLVEPRTECAHLPLGIVSPGKTTGLILDVGGATRSLLGSCRASYESRGAVRDVSLRLPPI